MNPNEVLEKKELAPKTRVVYASVIKRLQKLQFKFPLKTPERITYIKEFFEEFKPSTKLDMLNVVIVLRTILELPVTNLKSMRGELQKERVSGNITKMADVGKTLPTLVEFKADLQKAFDAGDWKKFIVNYLFLSYGVRNLDVDVTITSTPDESKNFLVPKGKKVTYIRNTYKTVKTHGPKTVVIEDPQFVKAVKKLGDGPLFADNQLSNGLRKLYMDKMSESKIFKMLIDDAYDKKDTVEINRLGESRGTSIATIKKFYDVNAEEAVIREI
jgi:hypothetical protein